MHVERVPLILRDGTPVLLRRTKPADEELLRAFRESIAAHAPASGPLRFQAETAGDLPMLADSSDPSRLLTLMALRTFDGEERVIGAAAYVRGKGRAAEIVLGVEPEFRGLGLASGLLTRLGVLAAHHDIVRFEVCAETADPGLLDVLESSAFPRLEDVGPGLIGFDLANASGPSSGLSEVRDRVATAASLHPFFHPASVAVVGASRDPKSLGYRTLQALVVGRFAGPVYAVNPSARSIGPFPAYDSVGALPERIDLAIVLVPQRHVMSVVDDCARHGVRALIVITAGFAEVDDAGRALQDELLAKVRGHGMRMVGPNCMGLLNLDPDVRLSATFAAVTPPPGAVAMSSQSGALGLAVLASAERLGIGLSSFVSVGNKADVSSNDLLQYWEDDPRTRVILLYVESFGNPRRFARIARRVGHRKPIIAVKSGRTHAGTRAAGSHTAALASNDRAVDALFRQTGVIRADTMEEMFDLALLLSSQPLPRGPRVAILTNAGGPAILCADALDARGLEVVELGDDVRNALLAFLPPEASVANPVDMIASATPEAYERAAGILLASDQVDALVAIYAPIEAADLAPVEAALQRAIRAAPEQKPILTVLMGDEGRGVTRGLRDGVPCYAFPEAAARVLATAHRHAEWVRKPVGNPTTTPELDLEGARAICKAALAERGACWLSHDEVVGVLRAAGLPEPLGAVAHSADEAVSHAATFEGPVALKLLSRTLVHKTDVGGVLLDLETEDEVRAAYEQMHTRLTEAGHADAIEAVLVQPMVSGGVEVMAGMTVDPVFGPIVAFGLGGIMVEVLEDVAFRLTPLSQEDAQEMLSSIRGRALLDGFRGAPPVDKDALVQILLRISQLSDRIPEIDDLDLNPIFIGARGEGARVVDVRIHVGTP